MMRAIEPSDKAAAAQTPRNTSNGTAERRDSSSNGRASATGGPGTSECGWMMYSQPVAATMTPNDSRDAVAIRPALRMVQPPCRYEIRAPGHPSPQRPVVPAAQFHVHVRNAGCRELAGEDAVLASERVVFARVEPEVRVRAAQDRRYAAKSVERRVLFEPGELSPEVRVVVQGGLIARPAFHERELRRGMQSDVDGAVTALGEPADAASGARRDRSVAGIDCPNNVTRDERAPTLGRTEAVCPLLVGERPG